MTRVIYSFFMPILNVLSVAMFGKIKMIVINYSYYVRLSDKIKDIGASDNAVSKSKTYD